MRDWPMDPDKFANLTAVVRDHADAEVLERLAAAVDSLPEQQKYIVDAVMYEGLSRREVGRRLGIHRRTVARLLAAACEAVRVEMGWSADCSYEARKQLGLLQSVSDYLSDGELAATMEGRVRGDGRRLDAYAYLGRWER